MEFSLRVNRTSLTGKGKVLKSIFNLNRFILKLRINNLLKGNQVMYQKGKVVKMKNFKVKIRNNKAN